VRRPIGAGVVLVAVALMAWQSPARQALAAPSEAEQQARAHFQAAEARFAAGVFDEALAEYQAGYDAKPLPGFLVNIAQCQRRLGDLKTARATYQKFLLVAPDSPLVPQVKTMISEIDRLLAELDHGESAAATKDESAPVPAAAPTEAPAASATVLAPAPAASDTAPPPARRTRWWLWGTIGAVVVGGTITAFALSSGGSTTTIHDGSLGTLRR
jgi:tetratricopeptide (TPR) repeat protein